MIKLKALQKIEHSLTPSLPRSVMRTINRIAGDVQHMIKQSPDGHSKHIEMAHAHLHMKIYQKFGNNSESVMASAHDMLDSMVMPATPEAGQPQSA